VRVNGKEFTVEVAESGQLSVGAPSGATDAAADAAPAGGGEPVNASLAGNIFKVHVKKGDQVKAGDPLLIVEAMKMETTVPATRSGTVGDVFVAEGDKVSVGDPLVAIG
jgi:oxaloacetate decarboxylase alpha subunit